MISHFEEDGFFFWFLLAVLFGGGVAVPDSLIFFAPILIYFLSLLTRILLRQAGSLLPCLHAHPYLSLYMSTFILPT